MHLEFQSSNGFPFKVDDEDSTVLSRFEWHAQITAKGKPTRYFTAKVGAGRIYLSHLVMGQASAEGVVCLAIDGDPGNVTKENLAWVRQGVVSHRSPKPKRSLNGSKYRGVICVRPRGAGRRAGWAARLRCEDVVHHLGQFSNEADAARAYDGKAREIFGPFALVNFPKKTDPKPRGVGKLPSRSITATDGASLKVDRYDRPLLCRHTWSPSPEGYFTTISGVKVFMYQLVLGPGCLGGDNQVVYYNGDRTDHRLKNLRWKTTPRSRKAANNTRSMADYHALPQLAKARLGAILEAVERVEEPEMNRWMFNLDPHGFEDSMDRVLKEVEAWEGKGNSFVYAFRVKGREHDLADLAENFKTAKNAKRGGKSYSQLNPLSNCLYVGSSQGLTGRIKDHLGVGQKRSSMHLNQWALRPGLTLVLECARYAGGLPKDVLEALEDSLWLEERPMLGKLGGK